MTDQTAPDTTNHDRAARVLRKALDRIWGYDAPDWADVIAADLDLAGLLAPDLPTLADMTDDERAACIRMQCDTAPNRSVRGFIADIYPGGCRVIERDTWKWLSCSDDLVTPRPDLPRMEWPGDTPNKGPKVTFAMPAPTDPAPALPDGWLYADHKTRGRVIVTRPDPDADGDVVIVGPVPHGLTRTDVSWCKRDRLTYLDTEQEDDQ